MRSRSIGRRQGTTGGYRGRCKTRNHNRIEMATAFMKSFLVDIQIQYDAEGARPHSSRTIPSLCGADGAVWSMGAFRINETETGASVSGLTVVPYGLMASDSKFQNIPGIEKMKLSMTATHLIDEEEEGESIEDTFEYTREELLELEGGSQSIIFSGLPYPPPGMTVDCRLVFTLEVTYRIPDVPPPMQTLPAGYTGQFIFIVAGFLSLTCRDRYQHFSPSHRRTVPLRFLFLDPLLQCRLAQQIMPLLQVNVRIWIR